MLPSLIRFAHAAATDAATLLDFSCVADAAAAAATLLDAAARRCCLMLYALICR